jgi:hypothetical protein
MLVGCCAVDKERIELIEAALPMAPVPAEPCFSPVECERCELIDADSPGLVGRHDAGLASVSHGTS